ncbi:hypothetical protein NDU88_004755, partial [Pleurodeles waltl]
STGGHVVWFLFCSCGDCGPGALRPPNWNREQVLCVEGTSVSPSVNSAWCHGRRSW